MLSKIFICLLIVFLPVQSWAVIDMGFQHHKKTLQMPITTVAKIDHACHQNSASLSDSTHASHPSLENSDCNSCTLCMAIGFLQAQQIIDLMDSFSQAFYSINQSLIGVDVSSLTKPPIR